MTDAMNALNSSEHVEDEIVELRQLLERIDREVAAAYDWTRLDLAYDFRQEVDAEGVAVTRYGLAAFARDQMLANLIALNRAQYETSLASRAALGGNSAKRGRGSRRASTQESLLEDEVVGVAAPAKKARARRTS